MNFTKVHYLNYIVQSQASQVNGELLFELVTLRVNVII